MASGVKGWVGALVAAVALAPSVVLGQLTPTNELQTIQDAGGMAYSPDGTKVAIVGGNDVQIYSAASGQLLSVLWTGTIEVRVAFSPDGKTLAVAGNDLEIWDLTTNVKVATLSTSYANLWALAFSPDGKSIADAGNTTAGKWGIELWNLSTQSITTVLPTECQDSVRSIAFLPDGKSLQDIGQDLQASIDLELWSIPSGAPLNSTTLYKSQRSQFMASCAAFSPAGDKVAICLYGGDEPPPLQVFSTTTFKLLDNLPARPFIVQAVAFSPDGSTLADSGSDANSGGAGTVELWQLSTGNQLYNVPSISSYPFALSFSPDGKTILASGTAGSSTGPNYQNLDFLSSASGQSVLSVNVNSPAVSAAYSPDGKTVAWAGGIASTLTLWKPSSTTNPTIVYTPGSPTCVAYSSSGSLIADGGQASGAALLEIRNASTGALVRSLNTVATSIDSVAFSPDGTMLVSGGALQSGGGTSGILEVWDVATGALLSALGTYANDGVTSVAFSPDGEYVADGGISSTGGVAELWNVETPTFVYKFATTANQVTAISFTPDGTKVVDGGNAPTATASNQGVAELWSIADGSLVSRRSTPGQVYSLAVTPDGDELYVGSNQQILAYSLSSLYQLWNDSNVPFYGPVESVRVSPDGTQVTAGNNYTLFTAANPFKNVAAVSSLTINPSSVLGTQGATGTIKLVKPAPAGGETVYLSENSVYASIPSSVAIAAGATSATFPIVTYWTPSTITNTITLSAGGPTPAASMTILPSLKSISLSQSEVFGTMAVKATVSLSGPAPTGGVQVKLSSNSTVATVPASVSIPAGSTSVTFQVGTASVSSQKLAIVTASEGSLSETVQLLVDPSSLSGITISPSTVIGSSNTPVVGTVTLAATSASDVVVSLANTNSSVASMPASVTVPAGSLKATFAITPLFTTAYATDFIKASFAGVSSTATLGVFPLQVSSLSLSSSSVQGGSSVSGTVTVNAAVGVATVVKLTSNSSGVTIPATVTIPAGKSSVTFTIGTSSVTASTTASIAASLGTSAQSAKFTITP